ncbi:hypothetical protein BH24CHL1_BH24CHL1_20010 [soil metagenome]
MAHRRLARRALAALAVALLLLIPLGTVSAAPAGRVERVIVVFHESVSSPASVAAEMSQRHNGRTTAVYQHALKGFAAEVPAQAMAALARDPRVAFVELDQVVTAFDVPTGVNRIEADKKTGALDTGTTSVQTGVDVAILDTGIDAAHPDLNVVGGVNCVSGNPFRSSCQDGSFGDGNGHGTHVAGTVAAQDNGAGVVGVAPGARLWAVRVLDDNGSGSMSGIVAGIDWVTANAATIEVANMSLGCECSSSALDQALTKSTDAGVVYVVAAGNNGKDANTFSPAKHPQVIAVSAVADFDGKAGGAAAPTCRADVDDTLADFSNFGSVVDIAAPGVCINSTIPGGGYAQYSGTSMASSHAAGAAALYVVEKGTPKSSTRWSAVRSGLQSSGWSVPQSDPCGFSGGKSGERFLMLAACDSATAGDPENPPPTTASTFICAELACNFNGSASSDTDGAVASYAWNFGDNSMGSGETSSHTYLAAGTYTVMLTVTDDDNATHSTSKSVTVSSSSSATTLHVSDLTAASTPQGGQWTAHVTITIRDNTGSTVPNAKVTGSWSNGTTGTGSCSTGSTGQCTVSKGSIPKRTGSVTFTVTNVEGSLSYNSPANVETFITVTKP